MVSSRRPLLIAVALLAGAALLAWLSDALRAVDDPTRALDLVPAAPLQVPLRSPPNPLGNLYFGDLHIHTSYSSDAWLMGVRAVPDDAYRFARGEAIEHGVGYRIQIDRPLDFAAVTEHAEYLGMMRVHDPESPLVREALSERLATGSRLDMTRAFVEVGLRIAREGFAPFRIDPRAEADAWQSVVETAEMHNEPGVFTTFIGYEWSSQPDGANLHRNVIFAGGANAVPDRPLSAVDSENPETLLRQIELWNAQGMACIAIPHNANLSTGRMYGRRDFHGMPMSENYARLRRQYEPLSEVLQVKGASETHPRLSPDDAFAGFEIVESNMAMSGDAGLPSGGYARDALRLGLEMAHAEGFNPYRFGMIGASDGHNASSPIEESRYHGKLPLMDGAASLRLNTARLLPDDMTRATRWGSGGLAAIWAAENTRESLFAAMQRKETYATSGPRIRLRMFAGFGLDRLEGGSLSADAVTRAAYAQGVPMGGEFGPGEGAAQILVWAARDPHGAGLDRIQIIKLWLGADGRSEERIFDVAAGPNRQRDAQGRLVPLPNGVDLSTATYSEEIGEAYLQAIWTDPEFEADRPAIYYARVLEIDTPRWSTYDAVRLGTRPIDPATIQERAISSPIWYDPSKTQDLPETKP